MPILNTLTTLKLAGKSIGIVVLIRIWRPKSRMGNKADIQTLQIILFVECPWDLFIELFESLRIRISFAGMGTSSTNMIVLPNSNNLDILGGVYQTQQEEMLGDRSAYSF